jgi:type II secretory pathway pseudopilin PulG
MVLLIVATVVGALTPSVIRQISHARVNRAATSVASDFFLAQSMAGRQHFPVLVVFDTTNKTTTITQPPPASTTLISRHYGSDSEYHLITYVASLQSVEVYPNATGNSAITVTLSDGTYTRHVKMSRAGFVRIY